MSHQKVSFIKSAVRLLGYLFLISVSPWAAGILFVSEMIGIAEEIGEK